jgi:tRNA (guanine37-N1)-methyltransferase
MNLKELLKRRLTEKELLVAQKSFDTVGDVAIIDVPDELIKKEKIIAKTLLDSKKNIHVVAKKVGKRFGKYRRQKLKILAGEQRKITEYRESGVRMKLNVETCYFSPRLGTDRLNVAKKIKKDETVLVLFSGVAPYPLVIAKHSLAKKIVGVELNPVAHRFAEENVKINKIMNIKLYQGDVAEVLPSLPKFDHVFMPFPAGAKPFLSLALQKTRKVLYYYVFAQEEELSSIKKHIKGLIKCKISKPVKCGHRKPGEFRWRIDVKVY